MLICEYPTNDKLNMVQLLDYLYILSLVICAHTQFKQKNVRFYLNLSSSVHSGFHPIILWAA